MQVIIPYTSQYTPLPFHPPHERNYGQKLSYTDKSVRDNYISEESRNRFKVANLLDSSHTFQSWPTALAILEDIARKSAGSKMNNSIDVHRLQKNIDNWTIQVYFYYIFFNKRAFANGYIRCIATLNVMCDS